MAIKKGLSGPIEANTLAEKLGALNWAFDDPSDCPARTRQEAGKILGILGHVVNCGTQELWRKVWNKSAEREP